MSDPKKILVAVDFRDCCSAALHHACDLAKQSKAQLHLLHVITGAAADSTAEQDQVREALEKLSSVVSAEDELMLTTVKDVLTGASAQRVIVDYARKNDIDLIVMGTHGRKGLMRFALGSVAERVLRSAPCPVMVLHPGDSISPLIERAIEAIVERFGTEIKTESQNAGIEMVRDHVVSALDVSTSVSERILDHLQERGLCRWTSAGDSEPGGTITISPFDEVVDVSDDVASNYSDSPAIDLVHRAQQLRATDIHLDPKSHSEYSVRFRIDGKLEHYCVLSKDVATHLINRLKTISRLDTADPFTPKESRLTLPESMNDLEVRITTAPVAAGEAVALRLFALENIFVPLDQLGHTDASLHSVDAMLRRGEGLVLVTGPTGAGKSTTVYSMLQSLTASERNIVSIEDPVEFATPFIRQMSVDPKHGVTMASGMRTMLRMDPDVIFVGEIRDADAALIAMQAASSGKYVFSTLHTRDVASTITALRDLGVGDRSLSGNLTGIVCQRLVRRLCLECRQRVEPTNEQRQALEARSIEVPNSLFVRRGCDGCRHTGYQGRVGVFESALFQPELSAAIASGQSEQQVRTLLVDQGVTNLATDALQKAARGLTDWDEAASVHWL